MLPKQDTRVRPCQHLVPMFQPHRLWLSFLLGETSTPLTALLGALDKSPSHFGGKMQKGAEVCLRSRDTGTAICWDTGDDAHSKLCTSWISGCLVEEVRKRMLLVQLSSSDISANTSPRWAAALSVSHSYWSANPDRCCCINCTLSTC